MGFSNMIKTQECELPKKYFSGYITLQTVFKIMYYLSLEKYISYKKLKKMVGCRNPLTFIEILKFLEEMNNLKIIREGNKKIIKITETGENFYKMYSNFIVSYFKM